MPSWNRGIHSTPDEPGRSKLMQWVHANRDHAGDDCLFWPFARSRNGYCYTTRAGKPVAIHRYMAEYVHGPAPSPKHHAAHSCGRGADGCLNPRHISWKTNAENQLDRRDHGTAHGQGKAQQHVEAIRALAGKESVTVTAARFGMTETNVRDIQAGKIYGEGTQRRTWLTSEQKAAVRRLKGRKMTKDIARDFGVSETTVRGILRRA